MNTLLFLALLTFAVPVDSFLPAWHQSTWGWCSSRPQLAVNRQNNVGLRMGLRDFLRRKQPEPKKSTPLPSFPPQVLSSPSTPSPVVPAPPKQSAPAPMSPSPPKETTPSRPPLRMGEDPSTKEFSVNSLDAAESVQDKINRVKAGKMTQSEKEAFLDSVLSTGNSPESRKPLIKPRYEEEGRSKPSPFPADSLLRNVARGQKSDSFVTSDILEKAQTDSQKKKREYLDMVIDPNRFNSLSTSGKIATGVTPQSGSSSASRKTPISSADGLKPTANKFMEKYLPTEVNKKGPNPMPSDLGARLGRQAMEHERARQQAEEERREREWQEKEKARLEREAILQEQVVRRQEEFKKQDEAVRQQREAEEESRLREEREKNEAEQKRLEELLKAQEAYWSTKLSKDQGLPDIEGLEDLDDDLETEESSSTSLDDPEDDPIPDVEEETSPTKVDVPVTFSSLNDVGKQKIDDRDFMEDQARRKSEIERAKDVQLEKLKALNSPLPPAPSRFEQPSMSPAFKFEPQQKVERSPPSSRGLKFEPQKPAHAKPASVGFVQGQSTAYEPLGLAPNQIKAFKIEEPEEPPSPEPEKKPVDLFSSIADRIAPPKTSPKPSPKKKDGPIRMSIPLDDDDEEEEDYGVDVRSNKGMSVAEAMKRTSSSDSDQEQRSKKWGIDMTKF